MAKTKVNYDWLNIPPTEEEIDHIFDKNGIPIAEFLPIGIVEPKLTKLDSHWGTENFKFQVMEIIGVPFISGSLELVITYGGKLRRLIGAATQPVESDTNFLDPNINSNFAATLVSECIKNSAKKIGRNFGSELNDRGIITSTPQQKPSLNGRKKPDAVILDAPNNMQDKYNAAVEAVDEKAMAIIRAVYPDIKYTGIKKLNHA